MSARLPVTSLALAGVLLLAAGLNGCGSNSGGPSSTTTTTTTTTTTIPTSGTLTTGGAANVYLLNDVSSTSTLAPNNVLTFAATSTGSAAVPSATIPLNTLSPAGVALDGAGQLYVVGQDDTTGVSSVNVYAAGAAAGATPVRSFTINSAFQPIGIAVTAAGQAYVLEGEYSAYGYILASQIEAFAAGASSGAAATATIAGSATQLIDPQDIAVDTTGNVYVANYEDDGVSQILVFAAGANGSVAPSQAITFNGTITGVTVDSSANMYAAEVSTTGSASIVEYATGATGTPTPIKTLSGSSTGLSAATTGAVRVDAAGNLWLIQQTANTISTFTYLEAWPSNANGNVAPAISFASTALVNPNGAFAVR
jgi:hypothetical protein